MTEVDFKDLETRLALARAQVPHVRSCENVDNRCYSDRLLTLLDSPSSP